MSVSAVLIPVWRTWDVLCWGDTPLRLETTFPGSIFSSVFGALTVAMQDLVEENRFFGGLSLEKKVPLSVVIYVRRLPAVQGAYVRWRRRYWGWFWRLPWLRTILDIICIFSFVCDRHCCQIIEKIGRQIQVVQAWENNWESPSKTIWYRWLVRIVINCKETELKGCNRGDLVHGGVPLDVGSTYNLLFFRRTFE